MNTLSCAPLRVALSQLFNLQCEKAFCIIQAATALQVYVAAFQFKEFFMSDEKEKTEVTESEQENVAGGNDTDKTETVETNETTEESTHDGIDYSYLLELVTTIKANQEDLKKQVKTVSDAQSVIIDAGAVVREDKVADNETNEKKSSLSFDDLDLSI